jgi:cytoskeletal protein CcmA (bactofilin family)
MFNKAKQPPIKTLIAQGTQIQGHITFVEGLRIDGEVIGNIHAQDDAHSILVISDEAKVKGEIRANHIIINGAVQGPVFAARMLELQPKARIDGNVEYLAIEMHQGALITGQMRPILEIQEKPTLKLASMK